MELSSSFDALQMASSSLRFYTLQEWQNYFDWKSFRDVRKFEAFKPEITVDRDDLKDALSIDGGENIYLRHSSGSLDVGLSPDKFTCHILATATGEVQAPFIKFDRRKFFELLKAWPEKKLTFLWGQDTFEFQCKDYYHILMRCNGD